MSEQPPPLLSFLDRRHELTQKENTVTEQPKKRKAVLKLTVEFDHEGFDMAAIKEIVEAARGQGTIRSAKLTGLPTTTDLA